MTGGVVAVAAGLLPLGTLSQLVSIGSLLAFVLVCVGVIILRRTAPDVPRPFRVPGVPWVPVLGRAGLSGADGEPAVGHLGAAACVAGARSRDLLYVQPPPGAGEAGGGGRGRWQMQCLVCHPEQSEGDITQRLSPSLCSG